MIAFLLGALVPGWRQSLVLGALSVFIATGGAAVGFGESRKAELAAKNEQLAKRDLADALEVNRQNVATLQRMQEQAAKSDRIVADLRLSQEKAEVALKAARDRSITAPDAKEAVGNAIDMALDGIAETRGSK